MNNIFVRSITPDNTVGFDEFNQLLCVKTEGDHKTIFHVGDVRGKTCVLCGHGWELNGASFADQCYVREMEEFVHDTCRLRSLAWDEFWDVHKAFVGAHMRFSGLKKIPNQYWGNDPYSIKPWYTTAPLDKAGVMFTIGMRKKVWSIEVDTEMGLFVLPRAELTAVFAAEDVTKEFTENRMLIHAWGTKAMHQYIESMVKVLGLAQQR